MLNIQQQKGKIAQPLFDLDLKNVIPDELHLLLRVTDVLTRNLIKAGLTYDFNNCTSLSATYDINSWSRILSSV